MIRARVLALAVLAACGDSPKFAVDKLEDPTTCMDCHPKHYKEWSGSMHAYASDDPVFLAELTAAAIPALNNWRRFMLPP